MLRLPLLLLALSLLGGCAVYEYDDHDYRPYYYGGYKDHHHSGYPTRYYYYDRHDYRRYAPSVRYYDHDDQGRDRYERRRHDYDRRLDRRDHDYGRRDHRYGSHDRRVDGDKQFSSRSYSRGPTHKLQSKSAHRAAYKAQPQGRRVPQRDGRGER
ncbi:hypothetical protein YO5_03052 [Stutzerimonas stutzeri TS44]|nr:hypothetical protein YO5_03052 [Stutzerimonas stutzeri TS44]